MSYTAQAPVYNTDNGEKPPPSIEDERISPQTFYKLAALALESDSESDSEVEEYEAYQEPYYDYRYEERSRARSPSPEPVYRQSSSNYYGDDHRPQATYGRDEYRRPTVPHPNPTEEYRARKRAERAARAAQDDEPQKSHYSRRATSPEREYRRPHVPYPDSTEEHRARKRAERAARATQDDDEAQPSHYSRRAPSPERKEYRKDREEYRRPHVPDPPRYQCYSSRGRSPSPPPTRPVYQPESSSSSYSSSSRTRAEKLRRMEEEREDRERIREEIRAKQEMRKERLENLRAKGLEEEEERLKDRLRDPEYGYNCARKNVRVPEPRKGEKL
ncbi:hypothetical protein BGAL_0079g00290 [Botrytis galanthina]|uniref:Uncharacterized protein n=1 Tax=Botrytis galanthina TaxID=278940 RepID=A0A4S8R6G3_9HELO|nr:hypothetical protein BGAL_0079g00290 [Botrytis galanthina]